ncbi:hypothetical protein [Alistipes finegoldii]|jgi:hypothetical protein|uniref:hypothetical protein n=1 Tax=Alistipes finegoldii TaxID=214856 RepID=UPI003079D29C
MKKIAFINVRYGAGINGGSEVHCRMLAERLRDKYDVEVLTTTLKDFNNPSDQYPAGESHESGITIRRFVPHPGFNGRESRRLLQKSKPVRRLRYWLSQAGVLRLLAAIHPIWNLGFDKETAYQHSTVSYAPDLLRYIEEHRDDYAAFIPMCYFHAQTIFAGLQVPQKSHTDSDGTPGKMAFPGHLHPVVHAGSPYCVQHRSRTQAMPAHFRAAIGAEQHRRHRHRTRARRSVGACQSEIQSSG